ncbi:MAG TPA: HEAT repeat domain-containing protein [Terriglobales bacterium]|nr:HEAT repeat domain-containing protein [Terriglobales bacterium]
MNCDWVKQNVALYVYEELPDDQRHELERHVERCESCSVELGAFRAFHSAMRTVPAPEPTPNLLASSRMRLSEALEDAEQHRGWSRFTFDFAGWLHQARLAPALVLALIMVGFVGGGIAGWQVTRNAGGPGRDDGFKQPAEASIAAIRGITQDPASNSVRIRYDTLQPQTATGSLEDPKIQQLLLYAARNNYNSGVRMDSVNLLTQRPEDEKVRQALIFSLRYDNNPGVRLKALESLRGYVKTDTQVRDAVLEALVRDSNAGVRSNAITLLQPVMADGSVRQVLQHLADTDKNQFIRSESRRVLDSLPEID